MTNKASNGTKRAANEKNEDQEKKPKQNSDIEPPKTGWEGPIPNKDGGSDEGYLFMPPYAWSSKEFDVKYEASCLCGKLEFEYHGDPIDAKHCHCKTCQTIHGAPFQHAVLYPKIAVRLSHSCDPNYLKFYSTQEKHSDHSVPCKISCRNCGSHMFDEGRNMVMAYPSSFHFKDNHIPPEFAPSAHIFYGERIIDLDDDVPKWSGHKGKSELMPHAPDNSEHNIGKGKKHKADDKPRNR